MSSDWRGSYTVDKVPYTPKPVLCWRIFAPRTSFGTNPGLIITHGASSRSLYSKGMSDFINGFTTKSPLLAFEGNPNLKSRVKMFTTVVEHYEDKVLNLGGRSMGARAAVLSVTEKTRCLVLVSYPLQGGDERRQILLDLREDIKVLFIIGTEDELCDLDALNEVRKHMKAKTWLVKVVGASHGMDVKRVKDMGLVGQKTGIVAELFVGNEGIVEDKTEGFIRWYHGEDGKGGEAVWSDWRVEDESEVTLGLEKDSDDSTEKIHATKTPARKTPPKKSSIEETHAKKTPPTRRLTKKTRNKAQASKSDLESSAEIDNGTAKVGKRKAEDDSGSIATRTRGRRKTG